MFQPMDVVHAVDILLLGNDFLMQRNGRLHAFNDKFFQRPAHAHDGGVAGRRVHDQLGNHAVIKRRDGVTRINFGIHPYAEAARRMPFGNFTRAGSESLRVFGVDPAFDCMTVELDVLLFKADRAPSIVRIEPGVVQLLSEAGNAEEKFFVGNGVAQIVDNVCTISVEKAILTQGIMLQDAVNLLENSPSESERRFYGVVVEHLIAYS